MIKNKLLPFSQVKETFFSASTPKFSFHLSELYGGLPLLVRVGGDKSA
jgi:hypothetical protein